VCAIRGEEKGNKHPLHIPTDHEIVVKDVRLDVLHSGDLSDALRHESFPDARQERSVEEEELDVVGIVAHERE
jgi:hypothetical protein